MVEELSKDEVLELLEKICQDMEAARDELGELDAKVGDGDLGITVKLGFSAVRDNLSVLGDNDIGTIFVQSGIVFNKAAASTFGTLMATAFMEAGNAAKGLRKIKAENLAEMFSAAVNGVMQRGGAVQGECTILDSLVPAEKAVKQCVGKEMSLKQVVAEAAKSADFGAKATKNMMARHGRAGWLSERSRGIPDAGAVALALMLKSFSKHLGGLSLRCYGLDKRE